MVFHPNGVPFSFPRSLAIQFGADVVVMWIAAYLLSKITRSAGFGQKVMLAALLGSIPALRTDIPYWNWYNFPAVYTLSQLTIHRGGLHAWRNDPGENGQSRSKITAVES